MTRKELISTREYWITTIQLHLFEMIENFRKEKKYKKKDLADHLKFSKGYISQVLNGDFDHKVSKLVDLSLALGKVPKIEFIDIDKFLEEEKAMKIAPFAPNVNIILVGDAEATDILITNSSKTSIPSLFHEINITTSTN